MKQSLPCFASLYYDVFICGGLKTSVLLMVRTKTVIHAIFHFGVCSKYLWYTYHTSLLRSLLYLGSTAADSSVQAQMKPVLPASYFKSEPWALLLFALGFVPSAHGASQMDKDNHRGVNAWAATITQ